MMRMPGPGGAVEMMGGRMTRMLGPGGAVVMMGRRMTRMLGRGSPGGSGGMRGVRRSLLFRLGWGRLRPFFVSLAWVGLEVAGLGGRGVWSRGALMHTGISILVLAQPKVVITHFDLWNQRLNQDVVWTPLSPSYRH